VTAEVSRFYSSILDAFPMSEATLCGYFGYYLTEQLGEPKFTATAIAKCFTGCDLKAPTRIAPWLSEGLKGSPPRYVKVVGGYRLHRSFKAEISSKLGPERIQAQTSIELRSLESKFQEGPAKAFLKETIDCFEVGANRATIVMCWQLVMDHLSELVLQKHLKAFNEKLALVTNKRVKVSEVKSRDDFADIPEGIFIELLRSAGIINNDVRKSLDEKLGIRNTAAHASVVVIRASRAIGFVEDMIENVILKFPI
jgi:hypothetical protein